MATALVLNLSSVAAAADDGFRARFRSWCERHLIGPDPYQAYYNRSDTAEVIREFRMQAGRLRWKGITYVNEFQHDEYEMVLAVFASRIQLGNMTMHEISLAEGAIRDYPDARLIGLLPQLRRVENQ